MGAGKSTIGRNLAALLGKDFHDTDHAIEAHTGAQVSLIFDVEGEEGFRARETAMIDELTAKQGVVVATGGGAVLRPENRQLLRERGYVVYLHADVDTLVKRTRRDKKRPLLQNVDRRQKLTELLAARDALYRQTAHYVIETGRRSPRALARDIAQILSTIEHEAHSI